MKSGKPKTKRYQFGGTLRSQISGTRNAPPPTRPTPAPAKPKPVTPAPVKTAPQPTQQAPVPTPAPQSPSKGAPVMPVFNPADNLTMPPQVKAGAVSPVPPPPRSTIAPTPTLAKTTFSNPASIPASIVAGGVFDAFKKAGVSPAEVERYTKAALQQGKSAGLGAMPATPTKTTGGPFNVPPEIVNIPSARNKPPVGYADDLAHIYAAAAKNQPQIFGPQAPMPAGGPRPAASTMPATTATAKPAPLSPQYMKKGGAVKAYAKGGKVSSASSRGDGIAQRGKTKGRMV